MQQPIQDILGISESVAELRHFIPKVAARDAPVLITGETGTGKERVASAIHELSERCNASFVPVNCAALPETLIESELFGHERGSFTGAVRTQTGKAVEADGGTLFLDEIGEMHPYGQAKLLRFLESGAVDRIGSARTIPVNVRIVAATNQDLGDLLIERRFRPDLYYRLNVACIELEPLRNRTEDIPVLLESFVRHFNKRYGLNVGEPDDAFLDSCLDYDWPGNVRELRNMVEAVFIDPPSGPLRLQHLPPAFRRLILGHRQASSNERDDLVAALRRTNWNKSEAARELRLSRMTLYRKIARYKLSRSTTD